MKCDGTKMLKDALDDIKESVRQIRTMTDNENILDLLDDIDMDVIFIKEETE